MPLGSFEIDIYNDRDVFDNTNDYMDDSFNFYEEEIDSEEKIDHEKRQKEDKDSDYAESDESGTDYGTFGCS